MRNHSAVFYRDLNTTPPVIVRGEGCYLEDSTGRRYLDGSASAGVVGIGHGRTRDLGCARARRRQGHLRLQRDLHASVAGGAGAAASSTSRRPDMARRLFRLRRIGGQRVGLEARAAILRRARQAAEIQGDRALAELSRRDARDPVALRPHQLARSSIRRCCCRCRTSRRPTRIAARSAPGGRLHAGLRRRSRARDPARGAGTVAAFFAEPIVGTTAAGLTPHPDYYRRVREICDRYDVLFVADEVLCGYGRTGAPFAICALERRARHHHAGKGDWQRLRAARRDAGLGQGPRGVRLGHRPFRARPHLQRHAVRRASSA